MKLDSIKGALYGFAIGDALGSGDNTRVMLCVAEALHHHDVLNQCCRNLEKSGDRRIEEVVKENMGKPWQKWVDWSENRQLTHPTLDNGALVRCLSPFLFGKRWLAITQGRLTHNHIQSELAIGKYGQAIRYAGQYHHRGRPICELMGISDHVGNTYNNVMYWTTHTEKFSDAVERAANQSGAIAALTGGLVGTIYGYNSIPVGWINVLDQEVKDQLDKTLEWVERRK